MKPTSLLLSVMTFLSAIGLSSCATQAPALTEEHYVNERGEAFGIRKWNWQQPEAVVIATHGVSGSSKDFENLGEGLEEDGGGIALLSYELRGQGLDPVARRRGDMKSSERMAGDLYAIDSLVRAQFPEAKVIWLGESMGALITLHAFTGAKETQTPDGIALVSPPLRLERTVPQSQRDLLKFAATIAPRFRLPVDKLKPKEDVQLTTKSTHGEQSVKNPWHLETFTTRLLYRIDQLSEHAYSNFARVNVPALLLLGRKDAFTRAKDLQELSQQVSPETPVRVEIYEKSHHLLFYDVEKKKVIADTLAWIKSL